MWPGMGRYQGRCRCPSKVGLRRQLKMLNDASDRQPGATSYQPAETQARPIAELKCRGDTLESCGKRR